MSKEEKATNLLKYGYENIFHVPTPSQRTPLEHDELKHVLEYFHISVFGYTRINNEKCVYIITGCKEQMLVIYNDKEYAIDGKFLNNFSFDFCVRITEGTKKLLSERGIII